MDSASSASPGVLVRSGYLVEPSRPRSCTSPSHHPSWPGACLLWIGNGFLTSAVTIRPCDCMAARRWSFRGAFGFAGGPLLTCRVVMWDMCFERTSIGKGRYTRLKKNLENISGAYVSPGSGCVDKKHFVGYVDLVFGCMS